MEQTFDAFIVFNLPNGSHVKEVRKSMSGVCEKIHVCFLLTKTFYSEKNLAFIILLWMCKNTMFYPVWPTCLFYQALTVNVGIEESNTSRSSPVLPFFKLN